MGDESQRKNAVKREKSHQPRPKCTKVLERIKAIHRQLDSMIFKDLSIPRDVIIQSAISIFKFLVFMLFVSWSNSQLISTILCFHLLPKYFHIQILLSLSASHTQHVGSSAPLFLCARSHHCQLTPPTPLASHPSGQQVLSTSKMSLLGPPF